MNFLHAQFPDDKEEGIPDEMPTELDDEFGDDEDEGAVDFDLHDDRDDY